MISDELKMQILRKWLQMREPSFRLFLEICALLGMPVQTDLDLAQVIVEVATRSDHYRLLLQTNDYLDSLIAIWSEKDKSLMKRRITVIFNGLKQSTPLVKYMQDYVRLHTTPTDWEISTYNPVNKHVASCDTYSNVIGTRQLGSQFVVIFADGTTKTVHVKPGYAFKTRQLTAIQEQSEDL